MFCRWRNRIFCFCVLGIIFMFFVLFFCVSRFIFVFMIAYILACSVLGYMEAILFHVAYASKVKTFNYFHGDVHRHFVFIRLVLFLWAYGFWYDALLHLIPCMLIFPFWHDGVYYVSREYFVGGRINIARFAYQSRETTAVHSYDFPVRALLFFIGSLIWALFLGF